MNYLSFLRQNRGISQKDLAAQLGLSKTVLCQCERGWFARPPRGTEAKLRRFFGEEWSWERLMQPVPVVSLTGNSHGDQCAGGE